MTSLSNGELKESGVVYRAIRLTLTSGRQEYGRKPSELLLWFLSVSGKSVKSVASFNSDWEYLCDLEKQGVARVEFVKWG